MTEAPLERSQRELRAAQILMEQGLYDEAIPLAYQAGEDAARQALLAVGVAIPKTHAATIGLFGELLVSERLEREAGRALNILAQRRQRVMYEWMPACREDAESAIEQSRLVLAAAQLILKRYGPENASS